MDVYDPWVDAAEAKDEYDLTMTADLKNNHYDAVIIAVAHEQFIELGAKGIRALCKENAIIFDIKYVLDAADVDGRL